MGAEPRTRLEGSVPGGWLPLSHAECFREEGGFDLQALCDTDPERLALNGKRYGVTNLYTDYVQLLDERRPDVISIATRTPVKPAIVQAACARGVKAIYVEKPLANSIAECRTALAAAAQAGTVVVYGVNRRYHAVYRHARQLLLADEIGEVRDVVAEFGTAALLWAHPHTVDLMQFLLPGRRVLRVQAQLAPDSVEARTERLIDSDPRVEHAVFVFENGAHGIISRAGGCTLRVGGSKGTLTIHADGAYIQISRARGATSGYFLDQSLLHTAPARGATLVAFGELRSAVERSGASPIAPDEILTGLQMLVGCVWSHLRGGVPIAPTEIPEDLQVTGKYRGLYA